MERRQNVDLAPRLPPQGFCLVSDIYFYKKQTVFVQIAKSICMSYKIYLQQKTADQSGRSACCWQTGHVKLFLGQVDRFDQMHFFEIQ